MESGSTPESAVNAREAARDRLAQQIGQLLANEWLRNHTPGAETSASPLWAASEIRDRDEPSSRSADVGVSIPSNTSCCDRALERHT
jgi:hypothetical protein